MESNDVSYVMKDGSGRVVGLAGLAVGLWLGDFDFAPHMHAGNPALLSELPFVYSLPSLSWTARTK